MNPTTNQIHAISATALIRDRFSELPAEMYASLLMNFSELNRALGVDQIISSVVAEDGNLEQFEISLINTCANALTSSNPDIVADSESWPKWAVPLFLAGWSVQCIRDREKDAENMDIEVIGAANVLIIEISDLQTWLKENEYFE